MGGRGVEPRVELGHEEACGGAIDGVRVEACVDRDCDAEIDAGQQDVGEGG